MDPLEHPRDAVTRELREELDLEADFLFNDPLFITSRSTYGAKIPIHIDVTLWYVVKSDSSLPVNYDTRKFLDAKWFSFDSLPVDRVDPHLSRFMPKLLNYLR